MNLTVVKRFLGWDKYKNWGTCKHCGCEVILIMPKWYEEIFLNKLGTLKCTTCGNEEIV